MAAVVRGARLTPRALPCAAGGASQGSATLPSLSPFGWNEPGSGDKVSQGLGCKPDLPGGRVGRQLAGEGRRGPGPLRCRSLSPVGGQDAGGGGAHSIPELRTRVQLSSSLFIGAQPLPACTGLGLLVRLVQDILRFKSSARLPGCLAAWGQPFPILTSRISLLSSLQNQVASATIALKSCGTCFFPRIHWKRVPSCGKQLREAGSEGSRPALACRGTGAGHRGKQIPQGDKCIS